MKINSEVLLAVARYYINRGLAKERGWDKQADLDNISALADKSKLGYSSTSGTFFFKKGKNTLVITEMSFPNTMTLEEWKKI